MNRFGLSWRMLRRNWAAGENRVLFFALLIAVASVTAVGFFAERVERALAAQASEMIGADLVVIADHEIPAQLRDPAQGLALTRVETMTFPSMVGSLATEGTSALCEIKAVTRGFPLRGRLRIADTRGGPEYEARGIPAPGTIWVAPAVLDKLDARAGDSVRVGGASLTIAAVVVREPDSVLDYFGIAPRVLLNADDIPRTGLVQIGSRINYRLLLGGDAKDIAKYRTAATPALKRGERVEGVRDARSEVRVALDRAARFLGLAALLSVILAAVAVALAARRFTLRQMDHCAVMRCLGASQRDIFLLHFLQFVYLGAVASAAGVALGLAAQGALATLLAGFFTVTLPPPTLLPALQGGVTGFVLVLGFTIPPLMKLKGVSTLRVLRREVGAVERAGTLAYAAGIVALAVITVWQAGDLRLGAYAFAGFAIALGVAAFAGWVLMRSLSGLRGKLGTGIGGTAGGALRYGLANMRRRAAGSIVQIVALGIGIMAMLVLTVVRTDLIGKWQENIGRDAANHFVINVQPGQLRMVQDYFAERHLDTPDLYPMVRGRLVAINGAAVNPESYADERARRLSEREFNLSWARDNRADNRIVAGTWWSAAARDRQFSVEEGIARTLHIVVGDTLSYDIAGVKVDATVSNLRKVEWDSFKPNFFVIANPGVLEDRPASYITSFHVPAGNETVVNGLVRRFPNLSVIDLSAIMAQVRDISDRVSRAVEFVFLFALAAGLVVLYAAIAATHDERAVESAIMRTLGASRRQLVMLQLAEFVAIGFIAGLVAAGGAVSLALFLSENVLGIPYGFNPWVPLAGVLAGTAGVAVAGLFGTRAAINNPPLETLRSLA